MERGKREGRATGVRDEEQRTETGGKTTRLINSGLPGIHLESNACADIIPRADANTMY